MRLLFDNVLIEPLNEELTTSDFAIATDPNTEKPQKIGKVIEVGEGKFVKDGQEFINPALVRVGQKIIYKNWGNTDITLNGKKYVLLELKDIIGILDK